MLLAIQIIVHAGLLILAAESLRDIIFDEQDNLLRVGIDIAFAILLLVVIGSVIGAIQLFTFGSASIAIAIVTGALFLINQQRRKRR